MAHAPGYQFGRPDDIFVVGPIVIGSVRLRDEVTTDEARVLPDGTVLAIADANGLLQGIYDGITPGGRLLVHQSTTFGSAFVSLQNAGGLNITSTTLGPIEALDVNIVAGLTTVNQLELPIGSSVAPLGGGGAFVAGGAGGVSTASLARVVVGAFSDVAGSFIVEESFDAGVTFHQTGSTTAIVAGLASTIVRFVTGDTIRVTYTNGGGAQAVFQFRAILRAIT